MMTLIPPPPKLPVVVVEFPLTVLLRMTSVLAVNPIGGVALAVEPKYNPPPPLAPADELLEIVLFSTNKLPP